MQGKDVRNRHFIFSIVKSFIRIIAGGALWQGSYAIAGILLMVAEVLGVAEEL